jgi:dTDP-4-dehydrorhamnose 3,5-epimerase-like enzyme
MKAQIIQGGSHSDSRGKLTFNNSFDASRVKRIYTIENESPDFIRAWQGHKIEKRWFAAISGSFKVQLIEIDNWENPSKQLKREVFILDSHHLNILTVPSGYVSSIQALEQNAKLLVMADYSLGEIKDEYRFPPNYFK